MSGRGLIIPTRAGAMRLRPEAAADAAFLAALFTARTAPMLRLAGLPEPQVEQLVALQHRAQTSSYRSAFPNARFLVAELAGSSVGRLVVDDEPGGVYVVDVAFSPDWRGRGLGTALVAALQGVQAARGKGVRARVGVDNGASRALFAGLGFTDTGGGQPDVDVELAWSPPHRSRP